MHIPVQDGGFHAKGALVVLDRAYVAVKVNGNFPGNPQRNGLPTIQGVVLLCDAADGSLLAVMDSIEITLRREPPPRARWRRGTWRVKTPNSIAICGCGEQGRAQLAALAEVVSLEARLRVGHRPRKKRARFAREMREALAARRNGRAGYSRRDAAERHHRDRDERANAVPDQGMCFGRDLRRGGRAPTARTRTSWRPS